MAMTGYELIIADAINNALKNEANIIDTLADAFLSTNPHFNKEAFVRECLKDYVPKKKEKEKLDGIIVGAVYEIQDSRSEDPSWMGEGTHVRLLDIDKYDSSYPLRVGSLDDSERTTWIGLERLGMMIRMP